MPTKHLLTAVLTLLLPATAEITSIPLPNNNACNIFDSTGLICSQCQETLVPDLNQNSIECTCPTDTIQTHVECTTEEMQTASCHGISCGNCPSGMAVSLNHRQCVPCSIDQAIDDTTCQTFSKFNPTTNGCDCSNPPKSSPSKTPVVTRKLVEIYSSDGIATRFDCLRCPNGTAVISSELYDGGMEYYFSAGKRFLGDEKVCAECPDPKMYFDTDYTCTCPPGLLLTGEASIGPQSCLSQYPTIASDYTRAIFKKPSAIGMPSNEYEFTLDSIVYSHYYLKSASLCEFYDTANAESLQSCQALGNLCVLNMYDTTSAPCRQLATISQRRLGTYHNQEEWKETLPWLYYAAEANDVVNDKGIEMKMAFNKDDRFETEVEFRLVKYRLDGSFVGVEELTNQFTFCSDSNDNGWKTFGQGYRLEYSCDIDGILHQEMFFYDMFLVDKDVEACKGSNSNDVDCLYPVPVLNRNYIENGAFPNMNLGTLDEENDRYTRRFFLYDNQSGVTSSGLQAICYAKSIFLSIQIQADNPNRLTPPRLIIEYETRTIGPKNPPGTDLLLFKVDYSMKTDTFWESIQILIGFLGAFAVVVYSVKMNNWQSRQLQELGGPSNGSLTSMSFIVHGFMILCHTFVLLFFPFAVAICSYWYIFIKHQSSVFLLLPSDNEFYHDVGNEYYFLMLSFQGLFVCQTLYLAYTIFGQCRSSFILVDWERPKGRINNQISTWRKVLVANEFLDMQTSRKHSIAFSLALVGFFVTFDDAHNDRANIALRFASTTFFWCLASAIQWLWRFLFYERWYNEPRGQRFVDLCTVCNISLFILTEGHKGYYIHGRSPYQYSDCSMEELLESFRKEANGFTVSRGLDASSQGDQVFVFFCSSSFRNQINKIYSFLNRREVEADSSQLGKSELSVFLKGFIDQQPPPVQDGLKYVVREPLLSETVLGVTPADFRQSDPKCIMQPDSATWNRDYQFLSTTFLGIEVDLLLHDILTYNAVDLMFSNPAISIFVTYVMHLIRTAVASHLAKRNLSNASHIDERFLL